MITTASQSKRLACSTQQCPLSRNQERPTRNAKNAVFVPRSHPADDLSLQIRSIQGQAAEYRARSADRQLGAEILELLQKNPPKPSFYVSLFSDFPSSELNYMGLQSFGKGASKKLPARSPLEP